MPLINRIVFLGLLLHFIAGCKQAREEIIRTNEGTVTYSISYPDTTQYKMKSAFFPKSITLVFKDAKATYIASAGLGMIQLVNLIDNEKKTFTSLLIDNLRNNYGCRLTPEEIVENERKHQYEFKLTNETKRIAGIDCKKAIGTDNYSNSTIEVYYTPKVKFNYFNSPFKDMDHLMLEYTHTINNLTLKLSAAQVDLTTPVDSGLFEEKGNYRWVDQKYFYEHLNAL